MSAETRERESLTIIAQGLQAAWPICLGYVPIGLAFGVLAQKCGLTAIEIGLMSIIVFAGGSQFIAVSMLAAGASAAAVTATTFFINLRHMLMSSSLALHLRCTSRPRLALFAYGVTDESFAVNMMRFRAAGWSYGSALTVNHTANLAWLAATVAGGFGGQFIPAHAFGIDYALTAMFICLLSFQLWSAIHVLAALVAALLAAGLSLMMPVSVAVVISAVLAASAVMPFRRRVARRVEGT
jgi:4-azaleucine resistance transporter AzlC